MIKDLSLSYERVAQGLRKLSESNLDIIYLNKFSTDLDEYLFNRENDLMSVLEFIHKLFDSYDDKKTLFNIPEIMAVIELRNCFHHNQINSLDIFHKLSKLEKNQYFLLDSSSEKDSLYERIEIFKAYVSWNDFKYHLINSKKKYNYKAKTIDEILVYLDIEKFEKELINNELDNNIFIDAMTIIKNGLIQLEKHIGQFIEVNSLEGKLYRRLNSSNDIQKFKSLYIAEYSFNKDMLAFEYEKRFLSDYLLNNNIFVLYDCGEEIKFPMEILDDTFKFFKSDFLKMKAEKFKKISNR